MNEDLNPESDNLSSEEKEFEQVLRPKLFSDFKGQEKIVDNLEVFIQAAKQRLRRWRKLMTSLQSKRDLE